MVDKERVQKAKQSIYANEAKFTNQKINQGLQRISKTSSDLQSSLKIVEDSYPKVKNFDIALRSSLFGVVGGFNGEKTRNEVLSEAYANLRELKNSYEEWLDLKETIHPAEKLIRATKAIMSSIEISNYLKDIRLVQRLAKSEDYGTQTDEAVKRIVEAKTRIHDDYAKLMGLSVALSVFDEITSLESNGRKDDAKKLLDVATGDNWKKVLDDYRKKPKIVANGEKEKNEGAFLELPQEFSGLSDIYYDLQEKLISIKSKEEAEKLKEANILATTGAIIGLSVVASRLVHSEKEEFVKLFIENSNKDIEKKAKELGVGLSYKSLKQVIDIEKFVRAHEHVVDKLLEGAIDDYAKLASKIHEISKEEARRLADDVIDLEQRLVAIREGLRDSKESEDIGKIKAVGIAQFDV